MLPGHVKTEEHVLIYWEAFNVFVLTDTVENSVKLVLVTACLVRATVLINATTNAMGACITVTVRKDLMERIAR